MLCVQSGANWNNASNAGVWAANLNNNRTNANNNTGFRADCMPRTQQCDGGVEGGGFRPFGAKSLCRPLSSRCRVALDRRRRNSQ